MPLLTDMASDKDVEDVCRTVACPRCKAKPGERCKYDTYGVMWHPGHSHTGRWRKAFNLRRPVYPPPITVREFMAGAR